MEGGEVSAARTRQSSDVPPILRLVGWDVPMLSVPGPEAERTLYSSVGGVSCVCRPLWRKMVF